MAGIRRMLAPDELSHGLGGVSRGWCEDPQLQQEL